MNAKVTLDRSKLLGFDQLRAHSASAEAQGLTQADLATIGPKVGLKPQDIKTGSKRR